MKQSEMKSEYETHEEEAQQATTPRNVTDDLQKVREITMGCTKKIDHPLLGITHVTQDSHQLNKKKSK